MTKLALFRKLMTMFIFSEDFNKNIKFSRNGSILYVQLFIRILYCCLKNDLGGFDKIAVTPVQDNVWPQNLQRRCKKR